MFAYCTTSSGVGIEAQGAYPYTCPVVVPPSNPCSDQSGKVLGPKGQEIGVPVAGKTVPLSTCQQAGPDGPMCKYGQPPTEGGMWGKKDGKFTYYGDAGNFKGTGETCSRAAVGSEGAPPTTYPQPEQVPKGKCPGEVTVNGVTTRMNVPCDATTAATGGPSSAASSASSPANAVPGTTSTTHEYDCDSSGKCTRTTTTSTNGSGGLTETKKETVPIAKGTMCQEDPGNDMCSDEKSEFTSSCTDGAVVQECKGDAIQCAIAKEQARQWCEFATKKNALQAKGEEAVTGGKHPEGHPAKDIESKGVDFSAVIKKDDLMGGGSCPPDIPVPVRIAGGMVVWIRFSAICTQAEWLGRLLVGLTAIKCLGIVFVKGA